NSSCSAEVCGVRKSRRAPLRSLWRGWATDDIGRVGFRTGVVGSLLYSVVRFWLDVIATSHGDQAKLQAEVLALRRQVQVLERQIKRVRWSPGDRLLLAALRERIPPPAWAGLLVKPETVLGWQRELVRRKWAVIGSGRAGNPEIAWS